MFSFFFFFFFLSYVSCDCRLPLIQRLLRECGGGADSATQVLRRGSCQPAHTHTLFKFQQRGGTHLAIQLHKEFLIYALQIKAYEKLECPEERRKLAKEIYDNFIMKELLAHSHVSIKTSASLASRRGFLLSLRVSLPNYLIIR